jgi:hypothetical protein
MKGLLKRPLVVMLLGWAARKLLSRVRAGRRPPGIRRG